jgi:predicted 3-demethylubiquinone-9 3-methyltransferase (glyoxalase superfamily)
LAGNGLLVWPFPDALILETPMAQSVRPFVMFPNAANAEEAMQFYVSLFPNAKIEKLERFGAGQKGTVKSGALSIAGQASCSSTVRSRTPSI